MLRCRVDFPVSQLLEDKETLNIVDEVERNTYAYLAVDNEGYLEICGSNMAVALATSRLDEFLLHNTDEIKTDYNENQIKNEEVKDTKEKKPADDEPEVIWKRREVTPKVVKPPNKTNECQPTNLPDENKDTKPTETLPIVEKQVDKCIKEETNSSSSEECTRSTSETLSNLTSDSMTEPAVDGQVHVPTTNVLSGESLRVFALKLRYSESEVSSVLSKLGPEADKNLLLLELVKAQNSAKQIEEGSSLVERPPSTHIASDPNTLRAIVIDGSNVAMR